MVFDRFTRRFARGAPEDDDSQTEDTQVDDPEVVFNESEVYNFTQWC